MSTGLAYIQQHLDLESVGIGQWVATCPCHEDFEPSLCVTLRPDQDHRWKLWFHCKVCDSNGSDVCAATGMKPIRALWPTAEDVAGMEKPKLARPLPTPAETFFKWPEALTGDRLADLLEWRGFPDESVVRQHRLGWDGENYTLPVLHDGRLINVLRANPAALKPRLRAPRLWLGTHHSLYPDVPRRGWVLVVEGVWDALLGRTYGLPTVTGTGGAGTWLDEWSIAIGEDREIVVLYDCDKAGRHGAQKVKASIPHAVVVDLAPRNDGWDLSDHLRQWRKTDRLMELIRQCR